MTQNPFAGNDPAQPNPTNPPTSAGYPSYPSQSGFPGFPNQPELPAADGPDRPRTIDLAVLFSLTAVAAEFVANVAGQVLHSGAALTYTYTSGQTQFDGGQSVTYAQTNTGPMPLGAALIGFVITAGLWVLLIGLLRNGANWARVLLTIFGVLGVLAELADIVGALGTSPQNAGGIIQGGLGLAVVFLVVLALVLMYRRPANDFFRLRRYQRYQRGQRPR